MSPAFLFSELPGPHPLDQIFTTPQDIQNRLSAYPGALLEIGAGSSPVSMKLAFRHSNFLYIAEDIEKPHFTPDIAKWMEEN